MVGVFLPTLLSIATSLPVIDGFTPIQTIPPNVNSRSKILHSQLSASPETETLSLTLEKPLGLILEEIEKNLPNGVIVGSVSDSGSAASSGHVDSLVSSRVLSVEGVDVTAKGFDDIMDLIIDAPSPVSIDFEVPISESPLFEVGTPVTIKVLQGGKEVSVEAKVGDNLRRVLLDNQIELYRGMKKKLGNCGGGGQCTFCAVDFVDEEGWGVRSDYEDTKIGKWPKARLACLNNIQGPATIRIQ